MSELSQLIQINKNIEKQNEEIIRLLKIIANEAEDGKIEESIEEELNEEYLDENTLFRYGVSKSIEGKMGVGEVYFIEDKNMFKLSVDKNNTAIDNLTGSAKPNSFALEKLIANESMKNNVSLEEGTVIISLDNSNNLAESLKICVEQSAKKVFIPVSASTQLIGAPQQIMQLVKLDVYKNEENLIEKLFNK